MCRADGKLDINGGRAFGNRMRELRSERGIEFNGRYNNERSPGVLFPPARTVCLARPSPSGPGVKGPRRVWVFGGRSNGRPPFHRRGSLYSPVWTVMGVSGISGIAQERLTTGRSED